jgi:hypothetical protein
MMRAEDKTRTTVEKVRVYETTKPMLAAMRTELKDLSKKKPDATLSKSKVTIINRLLNDLVELLKDEPNAKYLDSLSDDELPQYSDVVLMLSQFDAAMVSFRIAHTAIFSGEHQWILTDEDEAELRGEDDDDEYHDEDENEEEDDDDGKEN